MSHPEWKRKFPEEKTWEGPRVAGSVEFDSLDVDSRNKILLILEAMDWPQLIYFSYDGSERVVAPFVVGVSSEGNPLLRGYQAEGMSRSGKGPGWRVFQIRKIENLENYQDFFYPDDFDFEGEYPWIHKVFKML
jgi:hypothetical protein